MPPWVVEKVVADLGAVARDLREFEEITMHD
jgi:hypothetical protein